MRVSNSLRRVAVSLYWIGVLCFLFILSMLLWIVIVGLTIVTVDILDEVFGS